MLKLPLPELFCIYYSLLRSKLRSRSHTLAIETGRHSRPKLHVHERLCQVCQCIEDETHLIIGCEVNTDERSHLFTRVTRAYPAFESLPNVEKCRFFYFLVKIIKLWHRSANLSIKVLPCVQRYWMGPTKITVILYGFYHGFFNCLFIHDCDLCHFQARCLCRFYLYHIQ